MRRADQPVGLGRAQELARRPLGREIDRRRVALLAAEELGEQRRLPEMPARLAEQQQPVAVARRHADHLVQPSRAARPPPIVGVGRIARPSVSL